MRSASNLSQQPLVMSIVAAPRVIQRADRAPAARHVVRAGRVRSCSKGLSDGWRQQDARRRGRPWPPDPAFRHGAALPCSRTMRRVQCPVDRVMIASRVGSMTSRSARGGRSHVDREDQRYGSELFPDRIRRERRRAGGGGWHFAEPARAAGSRDAGDDGRVSVRPWMEGRCAGRARAIRALDPHGGEPRRRHRAAAQDHAGLPRAAHRPALAEPAVGRRDASGRRILRGAGLRDTRRTRAGANRSRNADRHMGR